MTILDVVKGVSAKVGIDPLPSAAMAATTRPMIEMQHLANEVAQELSDRHDWSALKAFATITGDGVLLEFPFATYLPDFDRMIKKARVWPSSTPYATFTHYADLDTWLGIEVQNFEPTIGGWTIYGDAFHLKGAGGAAIANLSTVQFPYITKYRVRDNVGVAKAAFTADTDVFRLDERLLRLALIYRWKADHGQPYAEDMATFEDALAIRVGADKGSNILTVGHSRMPYDAHFAYPGILGP